MIRALTRLTLLLVVLACAASARAELPWIPNQCEGAGGAGEACTSDDDCAFHAWATTCVEHSPGDPTSRRCEIPCDRVQGAEVLPVHGACALGETCVAAPGGESHYCAATRFRMDLTLLDTCIAHFLEGTSPVLGDTNLCSLEAQLSSLLDQDQDHDFDIFDVDLCVKAFLDNPPCDPALGVCPAEDMVFCRADEDCGAGLYCDQDRFTCTRECGVIPSREPGVGDLDRTCDGALTVCDAERGRCEATEVSNLTCSVDRDCPAGAYCFLGACAATCSRALDCPDDGWFCGDDGRCRARPSPDAEAGFSFDPQRYALVFASDVVTLTGIEPDSSMAVLIMDLTSKRQVRENPSVGFGYRVEVTYAAKDDPVCMRAADSWSPEEREDCLISPDEQWVTPLSPFGTVFAVGQPTIPVRLNEPATDLLSPGVYNATVTVTFDNGSQDQFAVRFEKTTPSGEYQGSLTVSLGSAQNQLNPSAPLLVSMRLDIKEDTQVTWHDLLVAENLALGEDIVDVTEGYLIHGYIHGNESLPYANPRAASPGDNEIPIKGIYSPRHGIMRVIGVIDHDGDFCAGEQGECDEGDPNELKVQNPFARDIRRVIQFVGTFDDTNRRFFGTYRERFSGLVAQSDLTLDGAFLLTQSAPDESGLTLSEKLVSDARDPKFPSYAAIMAEIQSDVSRYCAGFGAEAARFTSADSYAGLYGDDARVFEDVVEFKDLIQQGLDNLQNEDERVEDSLTLYDFLAGRIVLCGDDAAGSAGTPLGSQAPACVDEETLRCGLALYRKALVAGYVSLGDLAGSGAGEHQLFCTKTLPTAGCDYAPSEAPSLFTLHEHNRFHQELAQATKFLADQELSDAFFALYRNRLNPFTQGAAQTFKSDKLHEAARLYDALLGQHFETSASSVMFAWPMAYFQGRGAEWMKEMRVLSSDRLDVLAQLIDLRRRVFASSGPADQMLGEFIAQNEYLAQVYMMALERQWEGNDFAFSGDADAAFVKVQSMLLTLHESRNPLGMVPNQVFFTNNDPSKTNWRSYHAVLAGEDGQGGLLALNRTQIDQAVENLQGALKDVDALEDQLFELNDQLEGEIDEICGSADDLPSCDDYLALLDELQGGSAEDIANQLADGVDNECSSLGVALNSGGFYNPKNQCESVISTFRASTDEYDPGCRLEAKDYTIEVRGEERACVGGEMGAMLVELSQLANERQGMVEDLQGVVDDINLFFEVRGYVEGINAGRRVAHLTARILNFIATWMDTEFKSAEELVDDAVEAGNCIVIAGMAVGTDCPQKISLAVSRTSASAMRATGERIAMTLREETDNILETIDTEFDLAIERKEAYAELVDLQGEVDALTKGLKANLDASFARAVAMEQLRLKARDAASGINDRTSLLLDHLIGRESGSALVANHLVRESSSTFRDILEVSYRMVMAFAHRYNLSKAEENQLVQKVYGAVTLEDIESLAALLSERERTYCSREAIDCDAFNNLSVLKVSLQETLFPELRDIIDPATGKLVTKGEQFHNIITSPPYLRRRVRGIYHVDQIEIPFTIPLTSARVGDRDFWTLDPTQCNHVLDGDPTGGQLAGGTLAVNVVGENLDEDHQSISFEMARGHVDQVRACHAETVSENGELPRLDYPVLTHVVGYAPESALGQRIAPPTFFVKSGELLACINEPERRGVVDDPSCFRFFGRDRSLAAPDYTLTIPLSIDGADTKNTWLRGEGLPRAARPVIEDVVVYLRYRSRPITEP